MNIFLIRHALSEANLDKTIHTTVSDHAIALSHIGIKKAQDTGKFLKQYLSSHLDRGEQVRMWVSPYVRTSRVIPA